MGGIVLGAGLVAGAVALYLGGVETRGRTLEEITTVVPAADRAVGA